MSASGKRALELGGLIRRPPLRVMLGLALAALAVSVPPPTLTWAVKTAAPLPKSRIKVVNADGSGRKTLHGGYGYYNLRAIAWTPTGDRLTYIVVPFVGEPRLGGIFLDSLQRYTIDVSLLGSPGDFAWSPDGTKIVYSALCESGCRGSSFVKPLLPVDAEPLFTVDLATGSTTRITKISTIARLPDWSPDGSKIVFQGATSESEDQQAIYVYEIANRNLTRITPRDGYSFQPKWSPDGTRVGFIIDGFPDQSVVVSDPDGRSRQRLTEKDIHVYVDSFDWSPDGSKIVYAETNTSLTASPIYVLDIATRTVRRISTQKTWAEGVSWSPDGTKIAYIDSTR